MIVDCEKCGAKYNNQTTKQCSLCKPFYPKKNITKLDSAIFHLRRDIINERKKVVRSNNDNDNIDGSKIVK